ncbi:MAG TPA: J domain-containing protein, partial [Myxococcales bacterium]|nr:J domain-containing protein [Myxococcales bacterium]
PLAPVVDEATIELSPAEAEILPLPPEPLAGAGGEVATDPNVPIFPWQPMAPTPAERVWRMNAPGAAAPPQPPGLTPRGQQPQPPPEADLWRIVSFDQGGQDALSNSFEEALKRVDAHLENIVGLAPEAMVEAQVEEMVGPGAQAQAPLQPAPSGPPPPPVTGPQTGDIPAPSDETWSDSELSELEEFFGEEENDVAGDPSDPAEAARLRRQRLLRRAMENLGAPLGPRPPDAGVAGRPVPPSGPPTPTITPAPAISRTPEEQRLAEQIEGRFQQIRAGSDHFTTLGIGRDANRDVVKAAFLSLAKVFHPDRLPSSLSELAPKMTSVFEAVREAYEVLYDEGKRAAYLLALRAQGQAGPGRAPTGAGMQGPGARAASDAADIYKKGEVLFKKRDFSAAEEQYDRAYALDPRATYLAAKAWAIYMDPARKAEGARAKQLMNDAVTNDPLCDRGHYQLGVIARVEGDMERAERHFREAVKANPKHLEANQELRLIEMRRKNAPPKKGGGLFGR